MTLAEAPAVAAVEAASVVTATASGTTGLDRAYRLARLGFALVPTIAGLSVAVPAAGILWSTLVRHHAVGLAQSWVFLGLIPAALLILAGWLRFEAPQGILLTAKDAPDLFALIEKLRSYLKVPAIDAVYLTAGFAAKAVQRPSRGIFGGCRNEIVIGLPLLQSVSKAEAAVLIAHELGHLSGRENDKAAYVRRARLTWQHVLERQPRQPLALRLAFAPFTQLFARRFLAQSDFLERDAEFAADRCAAEIAGAEVTASALQRLCIAEAFLNEYWRRVGEEPVTAPEPTLRPYREMANFLPRMTEWEHATECLELALIEPGGTTHPSLIERLAALGVEPNLPGPVILSAAALIAPKLDSALDFFDAAWRETVAPAWRRTFEQLSPDTRRLLDLDAMAEKQPLDLAPALERARLAYFAGGLALAEKPHDDLVRWHPDNGRAFLSAGIAMLDGGSDAGLAALKTALQLAPRTDWTKTHADDWYRVGEALLQMEQDLGIDCLEQSLRIDPARTDLASFLVDRYLDRGPISATAA